MPGRWSPARAIRRRAPALAGVLAAALLIGACGTPMPPGQAEYIRYCAACHGADGRSVDGMLSTPNLANPVLLALASDEFLFQSVRMGRPGENGRTQPGTKMSVYGEDLGGPLDAETIRLIVSHVRQWQSEPAIPLDERYRAEGSAEAGGERYARDCAACHGPTGWGEIAPRLAGSTFQTIASDDFIRQSILLGRPGTRMPAFDYTDAEVDDVVAFVRTLGSPAAETSSVDGSHDLGRAARAGR